MKGFSEKALGEILTLQRGFDITKKEQTFGGVPIVSSSGISSYHNQVKVKAPGVVIGRKGTLGTVHYINKDFWPHDTTLWVKDFKGNDTRFLSYFLKTLKLENFDTGSSNPTLNRNHVHKIKVVFPELPIQKKISAFLSTYDNLIENNKRRIALLENMAEEIYREWFVRFRFPGYQTAEFEKGIPKGWDIKKIGDIYKTASGGTPSRKNDNNYDGNINWLKTGELKNKFVFESVEKITLQGLESSSAKVFPAETVVIAMYCAMPDITILAEPSATNQACCAFLPKEKYLSYIYTYYLIKFSQIHMIQYAHGAAQQNLSQDLIKGFNLLLADKESIQKFGGTIEPIFEEIKVLMQINENLTKTKLSLLPRLISGKLSVEDLDIKFPPSMQEEVVNTEKSVA
ncbi:MAG: restriction endonuclease subunit S [Methylomarinum sp.]|nr:restriction endonuclease subunit S [Methylomarinum sp.]